MKNPKIINLTEFQTLLLTRLAGTNIGIFKKLSTFATQLLYPKIFDISNLQSLEDKELLPRNVNTYFDQYLEDFLSMEVVDGKHN